MKRVKDNYTHRKIGFLTVSIFLEKDKNLTYSQLMSFDLKIVFLSLFFLIPQKISKKRKG